jgi:glycerol-3-phosphate dehydrogenase (NAD(P)+)
MGRAIGVIGAGGWGTALAKLLCDKGDEVTLWCHGEATFREMEAKGENVTYLPGVPLPRQLKITPSLKEMVSEKEVLLFAVPSHLVREVLQGAVSHMVPHATLVCGTKGIEEGSLLTMGEVLVDLFGEPKRRHLTFLSGPSFALEVARGLPAAITLAAYDDEVGWLRM